MSLCISVGLLSGVTLPWVDKLTSNIIIMVLLIYASASFASVFIRETNKEEELMNIYEQIHAVP